MSRDDELKKLEGLRRIGVLSQDEYNRKKEALLSGGPSSVHGQALPQEPQTEDVTPPPYPSGGGETPPPNAQPGGQQTPPPYPPGESQTVGPQNPPPNYNNPYSQPYPSAGQQGSMPNPNDKSSIGFAILCFFIPLLGLILFLIWKKDTPKRAKSAGLGALIGVIVSIIVSIPVGIFVARSMQSYIDEYGRDPYNIVSEEPAPISPDEEEFEDWIEEDSDVDDSLSDIPSLSDEEYNYPLWMYGSMEKISQALDGYSDNISSDAENLSSISEESRTKLKGLCDSLKTACEEIINYETSEIPEDYRATHEEYIKTAKSFKEGAALLAAAIDKADNKKLAQCSEKFSEGSAHLYKSMELLLKATE